VFDIFVEGYYFLDIFNVAFMLKCIKTGICYKQNFDSVCLTYMLSDIILGNIDVDVALKLSNRFN